MTQLGEPRGAEIDASEGEVIVPARPRRDSLCSLPRAQSIGRKWGDGEDAGETLPLTGSSLTYETQIHCVSFL